MRKACLFAAITASLVGALYLGLPQTTLEASAVPWQPTTVKDVGLRNQLDRLFKETNGRLDFGRNVDMGGVSVTSTTSDTEQTVDISALGLSFIPAGFLQYSSDAGGYFYESNKGAWTNAAIKVKCSRGSNTSVLVPF